MTHELERSQFESRLPDARGYWEDLTVRIVDSAAPILREHREARAWWQPLARWSPAIGVAAAAVAVFTLVASPTAEPRPLSFEEMLGPDDAWSQAVVGGAPLGDVAALFLIESGGDR